MNLLFVCSRNRLRSPTAEAVFSVYEGLEVLSAGTSVDAENSISAELIDWADIVFAMEAVHRRRLNRQFGSLLRAKRVVVLDIPDNYEYMDARLIRVLKARVQPHLADMIPAMPVDETTLLYRPVGQIELDLIAESGFRAFPPRLEWQPIFYPVLNEEYATFIAREWNTKDAASGFVGYVLRFAVRTSHLAQFEIQKVGGATALEYWIPADRLATFNENIVGLIEVVSRYVGNTQFAGDRKTAS
jgi:predicted protein tyrosine phosphatase